MLLARLTRRNSFPVGSYGMLSTVPQALYAYLQRLCPDYRRQEPTVATLYAHTAILLTRNDTDTQEREKDRAQHICHARSFGSDN